MAPPPTVMEVVEDATQPGSSGTNKNAKQRRAEKFRSKKNTGQAKAISNRIDNSLRNPSLPAPRSNVIPQVVPITFVGLPHLCNDVWQNMASRGTRNFDRWFRGVDPDFQHGLVIKIKNKNNLMKIINLQKGIINRIFSFNIVYFNEDKKS
ncbi:hypothetical protein WDU94_010761 [Cyamophila willieti]